MSLKSKYTHKKCIASLAIGADGFTLFNGTTSTIYDGSLNYSNIVKEMHEMGVGLLYVTDDRTWNVMSDIKESYPHFIVGKMVLKRVDLKDFNEECAYCGKVRCHRWTAVACLSQVFNFYFDHIDHDPPA